MTYAVHHRFVMGGELDPNGVGAWNEVWQCTVNGDWASSATDEDAWLADRLPALLTWYATSAAKMHYLSRLSWAKINAIATDGTYLDPTHPHTKFATTPAVGSVSVANINCPDESVCWSWTTSKLRGPGSHGRIYPPNATNRNATGGQMISGTEQSNHATAAKALLTILNTTVGDAVFTPAIASNKDASLTNITGVRIGAVIDSQRRRRDKLSESYVSAVWP